MLIRTRSAIALGTVLVLAACSVPDSTIPEPDPTPTTALAPPTNDFPPPAVDATEGLDTGANDFITGLAVAGDTMVAAGTVYGNRLAPTFRYSTDDGATWQAGRLSAAAEAATPPDQGDQGGAVAVTTVGGATRWVVVGDDWHGTITWTSADGRTWDRHDPSPAQIADAAEVVDVTAVPGGFVAVGTDADDAPTAWTSTDGADWRGRRLPGSGSPAAVAGKGDVLVAVGSHDDGFATWRSPDRGRTWLRGKNPPKPADDGDFSRDLDDVTSTGSGFTAIGSYYGEDWRPASYTSTDGRSWRQDEDELLAGSGEITYGTTVRAVGGQELAATQEYEPEEQPRLWFRRKSSWRESTTPLHSGRDRLDSGDWSMSDLARGTKSWMAAVTRSTNGRLIGELWRSTDGGATFDQVVLPEAALNQPVTFPYAIAPTAAGEETLVLGDSRRRPVVWSRTGNEPFGPARLVSGLSSDRLTGVAIGPKDTLVYGSRQADGLEEAVVWRRQDDRWVDTGAQAFSTDGNQYGSSEIRRIAWLRGRWVAVGSVTENGDRNDSALVATSTDGLRWTKGRPARTYAKVGGDSRYAVTDLQGSEDRNRAMHDVTVVGDRLLAVGNSAEGTGKGSGMAATIWTSSDERTWTMRRLPLNGLDWSTMNAVAVRGSTIVVLGTGAQTSKTAKTSKAPTQLVSWHSADGGRTWRQQLLDPALYTERFSLVALTSGFAVLSHTVEITSRPALLLSDDGLGWRSQPMTAVTLPPGEGATVDGAVADGDDLRLLIRTTNRAGAGSRLVVQPTR